MAQCNFVNQKLHAGKCKFMADEANLIFLLLASYGLLDLKVFGKFRLAGLVRLSD